MQLSSDLHLLRPGVVLKAPKFWFAVPYREERDYRNCYKLRDLFGLCEEEVSPRYRSKNEAVRRDAAYVDNLVAPKLDGVSQIFLRDHTDAIPLAGRLLVLTEKPALHLEHGARGLLSSGNQFLNHNFYAGVLDINKENYSGGWNEGDPVVLFNMGSTIDNYTAAIPPEVIKHEGKITFLARRMSFG